MGKTYYSEDLGKPGSKTFEALVALLKTHGDLAFAAEQLNLEFRAVEDIFLYEGDNPQMSEASLILYGTVLEGRAHQQTYAKKLFLYHLSLRGIVSEAIAAQRWFDYQWFRRERVKDPDFDLAWQEALEQAAGRLHAEAWRRGYEGVNKPIVWQGEVSLKRDPLTGYPVIDPETDDYVTQTVKEYSDTLLAMLLKKHDPSFRDSLKIDQRTHFSADGFDLSASVAALSDNELKLLVKMTKSQIKDDDADGDSGSTEGS